MPLPPSLLTLLDDMSRADLEHMRDWYATCIFWSTLAVAIGCAMEVPEVIHEFRPQLFANKHEKLIKFLSSTGLALVVLGLAGELCFEHWRSGYEGLLQGYNEILLEDTERHTASAEIEAGYAKERAANADLKRVQLEDRIANIFGPRQLTPNQSARIAKKLRDVGWLRAIKVDVYVYGVDNPYSLSDFEDSRSVAVAVVQTLKAANLDVAGWLLESCQGGSASNLVVGFAGVKDAAHDFAVGSELVKAFQPEIGTDPNVERFLFPAAACQQVLPIVKAKLNQRKNDATINIVVGRKIPPVLTREMLEPADERDDPARP